jgi:hypothetical protein
MWASLRGVGIVVGLVVALSPAVARGQSAQPPCPPGTTLATVDMSRTGATDTDVLPTPSDLTATHHATFDAFVDFTGPPASVNNQVTITPPPGLEATTVPGDGSPDLAEVEFVAPATPATLTFTVSWTQAENYPSTQDCTSSLEVSVTTVADTPTKMSHAFGALQHWAGHRGSPQNVLSVAWTLVVDAKHGDAEPVTVSARAVNGRVLPDATTRAVTSTFNPFHLHLQPLTAQSNLIRLRSATTGFDHTATHIVDIVNASVLVYPPRRGATVHRGIAVDVTQGSDVLARYRLLTTCRLRRHLACKPMPHGGT